MIGDCCTIRDYQYTITKINVKSAIIITLFFEIAVKVNN